MAPGEKLFDGTRVGRAYDGLKNWISKYEDHLSEKYLTPVREHLDNMGDDLQQAAESGHTKGGMQIPGQLRAVAEGVGGLMKMVPIGRNLRSTVEANIVPPEFPEGRGLSKELKAIGTPAEGFEHIHPDLLKHMEEDELAHIKGDKRSQVNIQKEYDRIN